MRRGYIGLTRKAGEVFFFFLVNEAGRSVPAYVGRDEYNLAGAKGELKWVKNERNRLISR